MSTVAFTPIAKRLTETRDIESLPNLELWCEKMNREAVQLHAQGDHFLINSPTLRWLFNAFPLVLAYLGDIQQCEQQLQKIIDFWSIKYSQYQDDKILENLIDPTINLLRLFKLTHQDEKFIQLLNEIDILNKEKIVLGGHTVDKKLLDKNLKVLSTAFIDEKIKYLIKNNEFEEIINLESCLPEEVVNSDLYKEPKVLALINLNENNEAASICLNEVKKRKSIKSAVYLYRLYEIFKKLNHHDKSKTTLSHLVENLKKTEISSLSELNFSSIIIKEADLKETNPLVKATLSGYKKVKDEFNLALLLRVLQAKSPSKEKEEEITSIISKTDYVALKAKPRNNNTPWLIKTKNEIDKIICNN